MEPNHKVLAPMLGPAADGVASEHARGTGWSAWKSAGHAWWARQLGAAHPEPPPSAPPILCETFVLDRLFRRRPWRPCLAEGATHDF